MLLMCGCRRPAMHRESWPGVANVWSRDGKEFCGSIHFNASRQVLSAHCLRRKPGVRDKDLPVPNWGSHGICRLDRSCAPDMASEHKGRPAALMISWLQKCSCSENRAGHLRASRRSSKVERLSARRWAEGLPTQFGELLKCERPLRPDEPKEHDRCP